jgi:hypothetical protein
VGTLVGTVEDLVGMPAEDAQIVAEAVEVAAGGSEVVPVGGASALG